MKYGDIMEIIYLILFILAATVYSIFSGLEEGNRILDRQYAIAGQYRPDLNKKWHQFKVARQSFSIITGMLIAYVIGSGIDGALDLLRCLFALGAIHWVIHDGAYNSVVYPGKGLLYSSKTSESFLEGFTVLRIPLFILTIIILFI